MTRRVCTVLIFIFLALACLPKISMATPYETNMAKEHMLIKPVINVYVGAAKYHQEFVNLQQQLNNADLGFTVAEVYKGTQADVQILFANSHYNCYQGESGYAYQAGNVYLARNCTSGSAAAAILFAHEFGHALGLEHDTSHCTVMNPKSIYVRTAHRISYPAHCSPRFSKRAEKMPYVPADLRALKDMHINHAPTANLILPQASYHVGDIVTFEWQAKDPDCNLEHIHLDWPLPGQSPFEDAIPLGNFCGLDAGEGQIGPMLLPGSYSFSVKVTDSYGETNTTTTSFTVTL